MSHDFELQIYPCYLMLTKEYPPEKYTWMYEKALVGVRPRCMPDITILDEYSNVCCVVEIGYTHAAKMLRYRKMGIPDVRWYTEDLALYYKECAEPAAVPLTCRR